MTSSLFFPIGSILLAFLLYGLFYQLLVGTQEEWENAIQAPSIYFDESLLRGAFLLALFLLAFYLAWGTSLWFNR